MADHIRYFYLTAGIILGAGTTHLYGIRTAIAIIFGIIVAALFYWRYRTPPSP